MLRLEQELLVEDSLSEYSDYQNQISKVFTGAVEKHTGRSIDGFSALENNLKEYPFQRVDCVAVPGVAADTESMSLLAPMIFPDFEQLVDRVITDHRPTLSAMAGAMENGKDVTIGVDHRQILGVAVVPCVYAAAMYESGEAKHGDFNTEIAVSAMLKHTKVMGMPAFHLMKGVFSMTRIVVPSINESNRTELPDGYYRDFNDASIDARKIYNSKSKLSSIAPSATSDVYNPRRVFMIGRDNLQKGYYMAPPSDGTIDEYMKDSYVLASGLDMSEGADGLFVGRLHRNTQITERSHAYGVVQEIADGVSETTGKKSFFIPDMKEFKKIKQAAQTKRKSNPKSE